MQDSDPRRLVTKQVLWPVELIRHRIKVVRWADFEPIHGLSRAEHPWRESNSHPQLRKLALYPLSYRGLRHCAGALGRTRTCNPRFRKPVRYQLRYKGFVEIRGS